jgi:hypothetical protein
MKTPLAVLLVGGLTAFANAGIDIPKSIYKVDQIEEASAKAVKENKGLAFVMSDPGTSCGLCVAATQLAFKNLKSHSIIVFLNSKDDNRWEKLSPWVVTGFSEEKMGKIIPKAVITSPDMSELWGQMSYQDLKQDAPYRGLRKQVDAILKGEAKPDHPADRFIYWPLKGKGSFYIGSFVGLDDKGGLRLKMLEGNKLQTIPLDRLSDPCASLALKLASREAATGPVDAAGGSHAIEAWTGSNGKTLQARFVSLEGDSITLEMEDGKTHTLPLERLDEASQLRAKALQAVHSP